MAQLWLKKQFRAHAKCHLVDRPKQKIPSDVAQKYASQKKNRGGGSQSDVAQKYALAKYASGKTEAAARAGETLKLSQEQFLFGLKSV